MAERTPAATRVLSDAAKLNRLIANELTSEQVTAPLMQDQQVNVTVQLPDTTQQMPGTVQIRGVITGLGVTAPPQRQVHSLTMTADTRVYDGRLRAVMIQFATEASGAEGVARDVLVGVVRRLEELQKLDRDAAPKEWQEL